MKNVNSIEMSRNFLNRFAQVTPIIDVNTSIESDLSKLNEIRQFAINSGDNHLLFKIHQLFASDIDELLNTIKNNMTTNTTVANETKD